MPSALVPHPMLDTGGIPDDDGYYSFTVSVSSKLASVHMILALILF